MFPLFFALDDEALAAIEATLRREVYPAGTLIYHQGEWPEAFYLVYEGEVRVTNSRGKVTIVRPGGFLGETALLTGSEHAETAQTITDVIVYAMPRPDFEAMLERHPHIALSLSRTLSARLQRLQKNETAPLLQDSESARPGTRAASALVFDRESGRISTHLWDQAIEWFAYLSTGAKIRLVIVALLFFWLVGVVAPWLVVQRLEGESLNMRETPAVVFVETAI
ncbi:MAG: cyclic nucleotide-binding domain-containing protein [Ardenticatenia bacterium]|nr:MAG: cyclic nucleotide-binding domain-containing protein [Ardenticatenia bacterium]